MEDRQRWSHSRLQLLLSCGEAYRREVLEKEFAPPSSSMVRGTAVHAVAKDSHERQQAAKAANPGGLKSIVLREALPSDEEAGDLAATVFETERKTSGIAAPRDEEGPAEKVIGQDKDLAVRLSRFYVSSVAPYVDPIDVERKVVVEPKDINIRVSGIFDLVTLEEAQIVIRDLKTGARRPDKGAAESSSQLSFYAFLYLLAENRLPDKVALDFLVQEKKAFSSPTKVSLESTRTLEDVAVIVARLNNAIAAVNAGVFLANGVGSWKCGPKWCRFHPTCPYVRRSA